MSFPTIDDAAYRVGLIGICELNNVSPLREVFVDSYFALAEHCRVLRAELDLPDKATLACRDFVRIAVRCSVREWKGLRPDDTRPMAADAGVPAVDRE